MCSLERNKCIIKILQTFHWHFSRFNQIFKSRSSESSLDITYAHGNFERLGWVNRWYNISPNDFRYALTDPTMQPALCSDLEPPPFDNKKSSNSPMWSSTAAAAAGCGCDSCGCSCGCDGGCSGCGSCGGCGGCGSCGGCGCCGGCCSWLVEGPPDMEGGVGSISE